MRRVFANLGAEEATPGPRTIRPDTPVGQLAAAFTALVDDPPWPWLADAHGLVPWLSTPAALDEAHAQGLALWGASPEIVRRVHDKAFAARVACDVDPLAGVGVVLDPHEATPRAIASAVADWPAWARARFTVKPRWGTSGRGRLAGVDGRLPGEMDPHRPIESLVRRGGAVVEPWFVRHLDLSSQWVIHERGDVELLGVTRQITRGAGVYLGCDVVVSPSGNKLGSGTMWDDDVMARARVVVMAACDAGYRGPCGVDAFVHAHPAGGEALRGIVELNARFTAGTVALGLVLQQGVRSSGRVTFRLGRGELLSREP